MYYCIAVVTIASPAFSRPFPEGARGVEIRTSGSRKYIEIKSHKEGVVVLHTEYYIGRNKVQSLTSTWTIDCPNRQMVAYYYSHGTQNVWKSDGNLWYTTHFLDSGKRVYRPVSEYYEYGCNGIVPGNGLEYK